MQQVVQNIRNGKLSVVDLPDPVARPGQVLIANRASVISPGTEKMLVDLAKKSLVGKARERPDHVRRVLEKLRNEGFFNTLRQVRDKLDEPMTLGYSSCGVVLACGDGVQEYKPGDVVASNGPHAGIVGVPRHLCALVPEGVAFEHAAFATIGAIALQGVRLSQTRLGEQAFVIGLGLVGQITILLLRAAGVRVAGTDLDDSKCRLARELGAELAETGLGAKRIEQWTRGRGADAVLITAATPSSQPVNLAAEAVRRKGRIVSVGSVGLDVSRRPMFFKEAELVVSCSYGPGRYDPNYEERGRDYPAGYVRWTEQRNLQAFVDLLGEGKLDVSRLISHRFPIGEGERAYELIEKGAEPYLGVVLDYPEVEPERLTRTIELRAPAPEGKVGVGCLGAGNFARAVLLPLVQKDGRIAPKLICAPGGLSAQHAGRKLGFEAVTTEESEVFTRDDLDALFVVTRHDQHARQVLAAIEAGKHVFVEKPLALTIEEIARIEQALVARGDSAPVVMVGFNRRFSPAAAAVRRHFASCDVPLTVSMRFNAGELPADHWNQDDEIGGGRIIGEGCHGIDLVTYLVGSPPVRVYAESVSHGDAETINDDQVFLTLRHANGSVSSVAYLSGGDRAYPKERVEVLGGGRVAVIDDFARVETWAGGKKQSTRSAQQDKGHRAEVEAFAQAVAGGGAAPIPWEELRSVSLAAILAVRSLREGRPFDIV